MRNKAENGFIQYSTDQTTEYSSIVESLKMNSLKDKNLYNARSARPASKTNGFVRRMSGGTTGPHGLTFSKKGATFAKRGIKSTMRRKSIDCSYGLHSHPAKVFEQGARQPSLPPIVVTTQAPHIEIENIIIPSSNERQRSLSGQDYYQQRPPSADSRSGIKIALPIRGGSLAKKDDRSSSIDCTSPHVAVTLQNGERRHSFASGNSSRRNSLFDKQSHSNTNSLKSAVVSRPLTANRNGYNTTPTASQPFAMTQPNKVDFEMSGHWTGDVERPETDRTPMLRQHYTEVKYDKRTHSVCSPSSIESAGKQSSRLNFSLARRRASLPNTSVFNHANADSSSSPEFYKTYTALTQQSTSQQVTLNSSESTYSPDKSSSSFPLGKELPRRDLLHRIEEIIPENSFNSSIKLNASTAKEKSALVNNTKNKFEDHACSNSLLNGEKISTKPFIESDLKARNQLESSCSTKLEISSLHISSNKISATEIPSKGPEAVQPKQSFFHVPEVGSQKKIISHLENKKEISKTEETLHFVFGASNQENVRSIDYFNSFESCSDKDNVIDVSTIHENDDDLCDNDFWRKRVILWLMQAQTGRDAEQVVRDKTPPPSPEPGTQETAIVVIYNGKESNG